VAWGELIPILQVAVGPAILISAVGLLLLGMTNRLGRVVDRSRALVRAAREAAPPERELQVAQLRILDRRARRMRAAIAWACVSALFAALLVALVFVTALLRLDSAAAIVVAFVACLGSLIAALLLFFADIHLSLVALRLETATLLDERR
jgi:Sec-independent protein translocase protein TatA